MVLLLFSPVLVNFHFGENLGMMFHRLLLFENQSMS